MATTSCMDLAYTQVQPRRPWRIQGPRPSMEEEKEEEAGTSFWKARNFRPQPGTSGPRTLQPARNLWPPEPRPAPSTPTLWIARNPAGTCPELPEPETSGPTRNFRPACVQRLGPRAHVSPSHLPLRGLALYILPHLLLVRVSIGLAHILCESLDHPLGYFSSELTTSSEKIPQADSRPLQGNTIKTS